MPTQSSTEPDELLRWSNQRRRMTRCSSSEAIARSASVALPAFTIVLIG
jgi:hypothetical protein